MTLLAGASAVQPAGAQPLQLAGEASLGSDFTQRGVWLWPGRPVAQAAVLLSGASRWSLGLAATAPLGYGAARQVVAHASVYWPLAADWQAQARLAGYRYPGSSDPNNYDRSETTLAATYRDLWSVAISVSRLSGEGSRLYGAVDLGLRWPLSERFALAAGWGRAELVAWPGIYYSYADVGLNWHDGPWRAGLRYLGPASSVRRYLREAAQAHVSVSATRVF